MAAEYVSLKVPELKKLLAEKGLPQTGNKADLIARLQENDQESAAPAAAEQKPAEAKEDEITYSDDEAAGAATSKPAAEDKPATDAAAPAQSATVAPETEKPTEADTSKTADGASAATAAAEEEKPAPSFAMGLSDTVVDDEARKRAERLKRFGLEEDEETKKRTERAAKFGIDSGAISKGLDAALPERARKRGRGPAGEGDAGRPGKRQSLDRRGRRGDHRQGGRGPRPQGGDRGERKGPGLLNDPAERAKAEKRAARFAAA